MFDRWLSKLHLPSFFCGVGLSVTMICTIMVIVHVIELSRIK